MSVWIYRLPALSDNYIFLLHDPESQTAAVVDPAEPEPVLQKLQVLGAQLTTIFNTHHHGDHVGANRALQQRYPGLVIYGGEGDRHRIPGQQVFLKADNSVNFGGHTAKVLFVPGHTRAHIAYYFPPQDLAPVQPEAFPSVADPLPLGKVGDLFCGDTLFAGGCGRLFEGSPKQMVHSLDQIRSLPDSTRIWCAHEYTLSNLRFAVTVDRDNVALNDRLAQVKSARQQQVATVPSVLNLEKLTNPFLRWDQPALQQAVKASDPIKTFARLRGRKDLF